MDREYISLFYICESAEPCEDPSLFSKSDGFLSFSFDNLTAAVKEIPSRRPDLILVELIEPLKDELVKSVSGIKQLFSNYWPAVFCLFRQLPETEIRVKLYENGVDEVLQIPFSVQEIKEKYKVYGQLVDLLQKNSARKKQMEKSRDYLERFKIELKKTKKDLFEDREALNSALKQIGQMTRERNRLKKEKARSEKTLLDNIQGFYEILCRLIEVRLEKNRGHGLRVAHISEFLGREFNIDEKKLDDLKKAAMLHQTGLLFVPEPVMQKRDGELSEYEKDLFVQYPVKGAVLLSNCSEFKDVAQIISGLHENSDGSGSPEGLKRRYIPLSSRILAGAVEFDRLRDQKGMEHLDILFESLEMLSGSRLDPTIVALLEKYAVLHMGSESYRVKGVGIHQLEPGMTLGTAIFTNTGTKLFSVNTLLTTDAIDKIKKYNRAYPVDETVYIRA